ncbi:thiamine diphosphokinase [Fervidobacterium pennivorans DSM 9078]|uniref:Thiamine diphosphokinase n=1 Tax=Fervidobacterium pennivorans (strain DSM 9078 / Ven5) TaxID=771875 RepID=H9UBC5_FERPD|nr:thiamine diphosphokinase [Fervidobacterium pennivorans]AFG34818.1 thiamine diphosphokinase [Fervidobacterium pennivorans DSM 9078]
MKKATIIINGNSKEIFYITGDILIAVDGGANELRKRKIYPNVVIGDMDSISEGLLKEYKEKEIECIVYPTEKDETDLELAIRYAIRKGFEEVEIINWLGERVDMLFAMVGILAKYSKDIKIKAVSEKIEVGVVYSEEVLKAVSGETWSILAFPEAELEIEGFKYPFKGKMVIEDPLGVSNEALGERVKINVKKGKVVYFRWKKKPL